MNRLVLGFFDGVHIAHQAVIMSAVKSGGNAAVVTFKNSPAKYFNKDFEYIYPREKSIEKMKSLGVRVVEVLDFETIADMSADDYLKYLIDKYHPVSISTGYNHTFGKNKTGNSQFLAANAEKYNYEYLCIPPQKYHNEIISSSFIRSLLKLGKIETAKELLGTNFFISGTVKRGAQIGRTLGFPTANISYPADIVEIPFGVYAAKAKNRKAVLNWGVKPTINKTNEPVAEVFITDYDSELYGENLEVEIIKKIRDERQFCNLEELTEQIKKDVEVCLKS